MEFKEAFDLDRAYERDKNLRRDDVTAVLKWVDQQPHLPTVDERTALLFLHACHYDIENARNILDMYYTARGLHPEILLFRNPKESPLRDHLDYGFQAVLPKLTPEGHCVRLSKLFDTRPEAFDLVQRTKLADMATTIWYNKNGPNEGMVVVGDMGGISFSHLLKFSTKVLRVQAHYFQDCSPLRLHAIHMINVSSIAVAIMAIVKTFLKKEVQEMMHFHENVEGLLKFVPKQCLPRDYGGELDDVKTLHERMKDELFEYADYFERDDQLRADESLRPASGSEGASGIRAFYETLRFW